MLMIFHSQNCYSQDRQIPNTFYAYQRHGYQQQTHYQGVQDTAQQHGFEGYCAHECVLLWAYYTIYIQHILQHSNRMKTEIIKINPQGNNFKQDLSQVYRKWENTNSDITIIVKPKQDCDPLYPAQQNQLGSNTGDEEGLSEDYSQKQMQASQCKSLDRKKKSYSECLTKRCQDFAGNLQDLQQNFNVFISTKDILPNMIVTEKTKKISNHHGNNTDRSKKKQSKIIDLKSKNIEDIRIKQEEESIVRVEEQSERQKQEDQGVPPIKILPIKISHQYEENTQHHQFPPLRQPPKIGHDEESQTSGKASIHRYTERESIIESLFVIEDKLNDAIGFIKTNKLFQLEEYLYDFKTKYTNMSDRVQVKWRLLMAYCKQNRKQYERAAILYQQVLDMSQNKPKLLLVDDADIHHRLGICYTESKRWNDGIVSFANALKLLKNNQKKIKYAECMNNLGSLYLTACKIEQAEQCFLISYDIKRNQLGEKSKKLVSTLLNLYECNILAHNYDQAHKLLTQLESIISSLNDSEMLSAALWRRRGKLNFLKGDLDLAERSYKKGLQTLTNRYSYSLQYGELCNNLAIVKLEQRQTSEARELLNTALVRLTFYYTKDSPSIMKIKSNLELLDKMDSRHNSNGHRSVDTFMEAKDQIKQE